MKIEQITVQKKAELERRHRRERDGRVRDRIKAVLLKSEGWSDVQIAQALRIHEETIRQHHKDWESEEKLKPENGGSHGRFSTAQSKELVAHLEAVTYDCVIKICAHVFKKTGFQYTVSGMTKWLRVNGFRYKMPKAVPGKADPEKQEEFIGKYLLLQDETPNDEPIVFMDSAHPTMATKIVCGWIKKGVDKPIAQTASRTRVNVMGAIELASMKVVSCCPEYVNAETTVSFFDQLKSAYPNAPKIHIILDQSGYHKSRLVQDSAIAKNIVLHYLPPYSPNLNPIERLWKVMNEQIRNNVLFDSAKKFRTAISDFFEKKIPKIAKSLRGRINDNFQTINPMPSG